MNITVTSTMWGDFKRSMAKQGVWFDSKGHLRKEVSTHMTCKEAFSKIKVGMVIDIQDNGNWYRDAVVVCVRGTYFNYCYGGANVRSCELPADDNDEIILKNQKGASAMNKLSAMARQLFEPDTKTLVKAGFLDTELHITEAGTEALLSILVASNKPALVTMANEVIAEAEEEKGC